MFKDSKRMFLPISDFQGQKGMALRLPHFIAVFHIEMKFRYRRISFIE